MSVMESILQAEAKANRMKDEASKESEKLLDEAKVEAHQKTDQIADETRIEIEKMDEETKITISNKAKEIKEANDKDCVKLEDIALNNQKVAVEEILRRIMS